MSRLSSEFLPWILLSIPKILPRIPAAFSHQFVGLTEHAFSFEWLSFLFSISYSLPISNFSSNSCDLFFFFLSICLNLRTMYILCVRFPFPIFLSTLKIRFYGFSRFSLKNLKYQFYNYKVSNLYLYIYKYKLKYVDININIFMIYRHKYKYI